MDRLLLLQLLPWTCEGGDRYPGLGLQRGCGGSVGGILQITCICMCEEAASGIGSVNSSHTYSSVRSRDLGHRLEPSAIHGSRHAIHTPATGECHCIGDLITGEDGLLPGRRSGSVRGMTQQASSFADSCDEIRIARLPIGLQTVCLGESPHATWKWPEPRSPGRRLSTLQYRLALPR